MRLPRKCFLLVAAAVLPAALAAPVAQAASPDTSGSSVKTYIVQVKDGVSESLVASNARGRGIEVTRVFHYALHGMVVRMTGDQAREMAADPRINVVMPDGVARISESSTTQTNPPSWGLDRVDQTVTTRDYKYMYPVSAGAGVTAYIIDTGLRTTHQDFTGRVGPGYNTASSDPTAVSDCNGHGTHVAGTVAGTKYGLAKLATVVPVRVLNCSGSGSWSGVIAGINWVIANHTTGPAVANMSLGGGAYSLVDTAVANLVADGVTVAVAAGNSNADACNSTPARTPSALTVAATDAADVKASFSNFGTCVDLYAPGVSITSDYKNNNSSTATMSGTSMASPHVAGAAALVLGANPTWTPAQVTYQLLEASSKDKVYYNVTGTPNRLLWVDKTNTSLGGGTY